MKYIVALFLMTLIVSCNSSEDKSIFPEPYDYSEINEEQINTYLTANNLVSLKTSNGLHYIIENQGDGQKPSASSNVTVAYKGYYLDGTIFDESTEGLSIGLNQVITGWTEGIPLFNEGGNGILLIPAHLGYGSFDYNSIPGGSVLIFDISLISVN
tara:strand:- start:72056 stop:72523 length:468 start_codon:yes stop_codon:yes gene_type:complete